MIVYDSCLITEARKQSPNTGARANNILHKELGYSIGEPARQSACEARPKARHAPLAAYAARVVEDVQELSRIHVFSCVTLIHLRRSSCALTLRPSETTMGPFLIGCMIRP